MRTLKFRIWNPSTNCFVEDVLQFDAFRLRCNKSSVWLEDDSPFVYDQFTGLTDKNGVEIYEGDIVEFVGGTTPFLSCGSYASDRHGKGTQLVVKWLESGCTLMPFHLVHRDTPNMVGNVGNYDLWNHSRSLVVIGNIHENPELLK